MARLCTACVRRCFSNRLRLLLTGRLVRRRLWRPVLPAGASPGQTAWKHVRAAPTTAAGV
ncbi:hypothetical protein [Streptomyces sp. XY332]|uniref:hypothetical protein n=1 Tax=Streptomyces sp. XY332 TaxID=1415561 RepID=UPI000ACC6DF2|nr:hypothetical protein [Streptomyces sp. XY332]